MDYISKKKSDTIEAVQCTGLQYLLKFKNCITIPLIKTSLLILYHRNIFFKRHVQLGISENSTGVIVMLPICRAFSSLKSFYTNIKVHMALVLNFLSNTPVRKTRNYFHLEPD